MKNSPHQERSKQANGRSEGTVPDQVDQEWLESNEENPIEDPQEVRMAMHEELDDFDPDALIPDETINLGDEFFID